jgi:hypothetical protein
MIVGIFSFLSSKFSFKPFSFPKSESTEVTLFPHTLSSLFLVNYNFLSYKHETRPLSVKIFLQQNCFFVFLGKVFFYLSMQLFFLFMRIFKYSK